MEVTVPTSWLWVIPALPLAGFIICGLMSLLSAKSPNGPERKLVALFAVGMPVLAFAATVAAAIQLSGSPSGVHGEVSLVQSLWSWFTIGDMSLPVGLAFDHLTAYMLLFITGIGSLIVLYSVGYMAHDRGFARFMCYLDLFLFSMIVLVMGDSIPLTFLGWEGVGVCSYLLIGFWNREHGNNDAARKAFIVNRIGDLGVLIGAFILFHLSGSLSYAGIEEWARSEAGAGSALLTAVTLFLFLGCTGKSAQVPLMVWLPDAMAGPTPVSALIHAATMVTSGIYLIARLGDVFVLAPVTMDVITVVAIVTALWAAVAALVQWDIKKVLAYSTVSQLGFMFLAVGVGAFDVALFHVLTHAFFKATLFLGAGSVIHACNDEQDMRRMGGLGKAMPITFIAMFLGWWAIIGLPGGAGFMSKDLILERALFSHGAIPGVVLYGAALVAAVLTALYMTRMMIHTFWSPSRVPESVHPHESPASMAIPLLVLGLGSLFAGVLWIGVIPQTGYIEGWLAPVVGLPQLVWAGGETHHVSSWIVAILATVGTGAAVAGAVIAKLKFKGGPKDTEVKPLDGFGASWTWGFDRVYQIVLVKPLHGVACILAHVVEKPLIGGSLRGLGAMVGAIADGYRPLQRAKVRESLLLSAIFVVLILGYVALDILL